MEGFVMTKGQSWPVEDETELEKLVEANTPIEVIAQKLGRSIGAIMVKCNRLGLDVKAKNTSLFLPLLKDLPTVEDTLKILAGALQTARIPGISRVEVNRLNVVATLAKTYKECLLGYLHSSEIEAKLLEMDEKYNQLLEQVTKDNEGKRVSGEVEPTPK
jgi:hypothetical protein